MRSCVCRTSWGAAIQKKKLGAELILFFSVWLILLKKPNFGMWLGGPGHYATSMHIQSGLHFFFGQAGKIQGLAGF